MASARNDAEEGAVPADPQACGVVSAQAQLRDVAGRLVGLLDPPAARDLAEASGRLERETLRVLVAGEAKRGKSTLVNALLGREVLPTGALPLTAVTTTLRYDTDERVEVTFLDGRQDRRPLVDLAEFVTEQANPGNTRRVDRVTVFLTAGLLARGLELVDTPGTGSVYAHNTESALRAYGQMDAALFVVSADPPVTAAEQQLLGQLRDQAATVFCVLNKTDLLDPADRAAVLEFTRGALEPVLGGSPEIFPTSARVRDPGFAAFAAAFTGYLAASRDIDSARSLARRARRLAIAAASEAAAGIAALAMDAEDLERRLRELDARLAGVDRRRQESLGLATVEVGRLLARTNAAAAALVASNRRRVQQAATSAAAEHAEAPLAEVEERGRERIAAEIRSVVDPWRESWATQLSAALAELDARLTGELAEQILAVRTAVAHLFTVDLPPLETPAGLHSAERFHYHFEVEPGLTDLLSATVRSHLPGAFGRRRVTAYLQRQAAESLERQVGRARADFQARLEQTRRELARQLDRRYADGAGRLAAAVRRAAAITSTAAVDRAELSEGLVARRDALEAITADLDRATAELQAG